MLGLGLRTCLVAKDRNEQKQPRELSSRAQWTSPSGKSHSQVYVGPFKAALPRLLMIAHSLGLSIWLRQRALYSENVKVDVLQSSRKPRAGVNSGQACEQSVISPHLGRRPFISLPKQAVAVPASIDSDLRTHHSKGTTCVSS
jgi:hypothetical protein